MSDAAAGWLGRLSLAFEKAEHGTRLARSEHEGPLRIQRVLEPEGAACPHVYLLHPPGGVVGATRSMSGLFKPESNSVAPRSRTDSTISPSAAPPSCEMSPLASQ